MRLDKNVSVGGWGAGIPARLGPVRIRHGPIKWATVLGSYYLGAKLRTRRVQKQIPSQSRVGVADREQDRGNGEFLCVSSVVDLGWLSTKSLFFVFQLQTINIY